MKFLSLDNLKIELLHLSSTAFKPFLFLLMTKHFLDFINIKINLSFNVFVAIYSLNFGVPFFV